MKRVVVITGASAGVGRATVRAFARRGADIGLVMAHDTPDRVARPPAPRGCRPRSSRGRRAVEDTRVLWGTVRARPHRFELRIGP